MFLSKEQTQKFPQQLASNRVRPRRFMTNANNSPKNSDGKSGGARLGMVSETSKKVTFLE